MSLADYFESTDGVGVLGTANSDGTVDLALYARPHVLDESTVAFIMGDRLSHENLKSNPQAAYLFLEAGDGYQGKRLYLLKAGEETDPEKIEAMRREHRRGRSYGETAKFLVQFQVTQTRPLVGD